MRAFAIAAIALAVFSAGAMAESYPLVCRGGSNMRIVVNHDVNSAGVAGDTTMLVYFQKAPVASSVAAPTPGTCTWIDRPMDAGEPAVFSIKGDKIDFAFQVTGDGRIVRDGSGLRLNVEGAHVSTVPRVWSTIVRGVLNGEEFAVHVTNRGSALVVE